MTCFFRVRFLLTLVSVATLYCLLSGVSCSRNQAVGVGLVAGALGGAGIGAAVVSGTTTSTATGAAVGAAVGAGVGAIGGSMIAEEDEN